MSERARGSFLAGLLAFGSALAISELLAGLIQKAPSLVISVGGVIVDNSPAALEDFAISLFGTNDKLALNIGIAVVTVLIGGLVGRTGTANGTGWLIGFGVVGALAALADPLVSRPLAFVVAFAAVGVGITVLRRLAKLANTVEDPEDGRVGDPTRRRFIGAAAGTGAIATVAAAGGRALVANRSIQVDNLDLPTVTGETVAPPGPAASFDVEGLSPVVTPNDVFYRIDTALVTPRVDPETWRLRVHGMVDRELEFTYEDLRSMDLEERYVTIACVSNKVGDDLVGNAKWTGVRLSKVLNNARVQTGADQVVGRSVDNWTAGFPTEFVFDGREPLIAFGMNDEPLPGRHGFPARLIVPGLYGYVSATKWLKEIELTTWDAFDGYWVPRGWSKEGPIKTQSRIDVPRPNSTVSSGEVVAAGVAWAPTRGIDRVEVQVDNAAWQQAEISEPLSGSAWVQWRVPLALDAGDHSLRVRATDGTGETQGETEVPPRPNGAEGWHTVLVSAA